MHLQKVFSVAMSELCEIILVENRDETVEKRTAVHVGAERGSTEAINECQVGQARGGASATSFTLPRAFPVL